MPTATASPILPRVCVAFLLLGALSAHATERLTLSIQGQQPIVTTPNGSDVPLDSNQRDSIAHASFTWKITPHGNVIVVTSDQNIILNILGGDIPVTAGDDIEIRGFIGNGQPHIGISNTHDKKITFTGWGHQEEADTYKFFLGTPESLPPAVTPDKSPRPAASSGANSWSTGQVTGVDPSDMPPPPPKPKEKMAPDLSLSPSVTASNDPAVPPTTTAALPATAEAPTLISAKLSEAPLVQGASQDEISVTKTIREIPAYVLPPNTTPSNFQNPGDISAAVTEQTGKITLGMHIIATSADSDQTWQMTVGPSGHVMLPDGNIIESSNLTWDDFQQRAAKFGFKTALPSTLAATLTFHIEGAVQIPGDHSVNPDSTTTIIDAMAACGGLTDDALPGQIRVIRDGTTYSVNLPQILNSDQPAPRIYAGDRIFVPTN